MARLIWRRTIEELEKEEKREEEVKLPSEKKKEKAIGEAMVKVLEEEIKNSGVEGFLKNNRAENLKKSMISELRSENDCNSENEDDFIWLARKSLIPLPFGFQFKRSKYLPIDITPSLN